jgi:putative phage-type endonuclease
MIINNNIEQGSPEWFAIRAGIPTASCFSKIVTSTGAISKSIKDYAMQLAGEKIIGTPEQPGFKSHWMERGNEVEGEAREYYEFIKDVKVNEVGFVSLDDPMCGGSPDGLVGNDGGLEIKCPKLSTHVKYLIAGKLPAEYHRQVHGYLFVTGLDWWDFMSYYPGMKEFIIRVYRDDEFNKMLAVGINTVNGMRSEIIEKIA